MIGWPFLVYCVGALCTGWMFLMRLPPAWYAGHCWSTIQLKPYQIYSNNIDCIVRDISTALELPQTTVP